MLPLAGSRVPSGHVTIVSAMHLGKAIVATDSTGIADYVVHDTTGRLVGANDPAGLADEIERMFSLPQELRRSGADGKAFASAHCDERHPVGQFSGVLASYGESACASAPRA